MFDDRSSIFRQYQKASQDSHSSRIDAASGLRLNKSLYWAHRSYLTNFIDLSNVYVTFKAKKSRMNTLMRRWKLRQLANWRAIQVGTAVATFDLRKVELTPLEQRKLTFDSHAMVTQLASSGFEKRQAELIVSALVTLTTANMDIVYKDMVTKLHQEIALQQIMAHLDAIRKDMVILEKSDFANLRSENTKMKRELEQLHNRLKEESLKVRAESKLDINLESSRISDMFTEQDTKLMEASTEFHQKKADLDHNNMEISKKMDLQVASLKTVLESLKLETIRYLAATVFSCLTIALGVYWLWR
ncbi:coiled-coil domain-containing protein 90B, mitochondrial isoform X1 [Nerophis lumbriciformis]|uniref:coiled-coil domain-containing protein 90B, mitochondrial isoform X1 n=1 Tax=Nerophis lumbriciformis TaxID=546530 RepID=UPI003BA8F456